MGGSTIWLARSSALAVSVMRPGDELRGRGDVMDELCGLAGERKELVTSSGTNGGQQLRADLGRVDAGGVGLELIDQLPCATPAGRTGLRSAAA